MSRGLALFLIAVGALLSTIGLIVMIVALRQLPARGVELLIAGLILEGVGVVLLIAAIALYRRSRPFGAGAQAADGASSVYVPNKPETHELDGAAYTVLYTPPVPGKHPRPSVLRVSTPVDARGEFHMAPQTWFDKTCLRFGLAVEVETGDALFDESCYIRSDTPEFAAAYLTDPVKRVAILDLRRLGFPEVTLTDGVLTANWTGFNPGAHDKPELCLDTAARLVLLARNLPAHRSEFEHRVGAHRKQWQVVFWLFLIAFASTIFSLIAFPVISGLELVVRALVVLVLGLPGFAYLSAMLLRGTSTSHHAWGALMIGALFLFPVGSVGATALTNGLADDSAPVVHNALVVEKYTSKSKNTTKYHVRVASWRNAGDTESFQISSTEYDAVTPHQSHLVVTTHPGAFGIEWLKSKRINARPGKK
jgi:hypothetical protein